MSELHNIFQNGPSNANHYSGYARHNVSSSGNSCLAPMPRNAPSERKDYCTSFYKSSWILKFGSLRMFRSVYIRLNLYVSLLEPLHCGSLSSCASFHAYNILGLRISPSRYIIHSLPCVREGAVKVGHRLSSRL